MFSGSSSDVAERCAGAHVKLARVQSDFHILAFTQFSYGWTKIARGRYTSEPPTNSGFSGHAKNNPLLPFDIFRQCRQCRQCRWTARQVQDAEERALAALEDKPGEKRVAELRKNVLAKEKTMRALREALVKLKQVDGAKRFYPPPLPPFSSPPSASIVHLFVGCFDFFLCCVLLRRRHA